METIAPVHTATVSSNAFIPYRIGLISPDSELLQRLVQGLVRPGVLVDSTTDPRDVRAWFASGPPDLIALDECLERPSPFELAAALQKASKGRTLLVILTRQVTPVPENSPFRIALKRDVHPRVASDRLIRAAAESRTDAVFDDKEIRAEVEVRGLRGDEGTHYQTLDIAPNAPSDAIRRSYDRLSLLLHPDRLRHLRDDTLREQAAALYDRIQAAYEVLRSGTERARYNRELRGDRPTSSGPFRNAAQASLSMEERASDPSARRALKTAQQALAGGDVAMARTQMQFALSREPGNEWIQQRLAELDALR